MVSTKEVLTAIQDHIDELSIGIAFIGTLMMLASNTEPGVYAGYAILFVSAVTYGGLPDIKFWNTVKQVGVPILILSVGGFILLQRATEVTVTQWFIDNLNSAVLFTVLSTVILKQFLKDR